MAKWSGPAAEPKFYIATLHSAQSCTFGGAGAVLLGPMGLVVSRMVRRCTVPNVIHLARAGGLGGWVLLGPMGLVVSPKCQKLYGLVRKPLATLHRAAGEPLRQAPNNQDPWARRQEWPLRRMDASVG